jgi:very-short-patch-repair endonuclease
MINKIFRGTAVVRRGLVTRAELRSNAWQPLFRDVFADADLERTHRLLCKAVNAFLLPAGAAIAGRSAAYLYGVHLVGGDDPVEILTPGRFGPMAGLTIHKGQLVATDRRTLDSISVTSPHRACWDLACWLEVVEAVVFVDAMAARRLVTRESLHLYMQDRAGERGYARVLQVVELMDSGAESPQESRLRVRMVLAGLPRPAVQHIVTRDGTFVARVDLAWPELKIAVEYDGRWHASSSQLEHDRKRLNRLLGQEWLVFHVTADQLRNNFDELVAQLRSAIRARARLLGRKID